jgi:hypothetical protein
MKNIDFQPSATTEKVFVASVTVGRHSVLLRLDAREKGVVRLDAAKPLMPMWEAIDSGGFRNQRQATAFAAKWLKAANAQKSTMPRL